MGDILDKLFHKEKYWNEIKKCIKSYTSKKDMQLIGKSILTVLKS